MLPHSPVGGDHARNETHGDCNDQLYGGDSCPEQIVKNLIVCHQLRKYLPSVCSARLGLLVVVSVLTVIATVLLVGASIPDLLAAVQTFGQVSCYLFVVCHPFIFFVKDGDRCPYLKPSDEGFSFSLTNFFSFFKLLSGKEKF
jgi:hypothetical protein